MHHANISGWQTAGDLHSLATADPESAIWVMPGSTGNAALSNITLTGPLDSNAVGFQNDAPSTFAVTLGPGNSGF